MNIEIKDKIGQCSKVKAPVRTWKKYPGDFDAAARAAHHYAKWYSRRMVIVPGNSYGRRVYHITTDDRDVKSFTGPTGHDATQVAVVTVAGGVFRAIVMRANEILRSSYSVPEQIVWAMAVPGATIELYWEGCRDAMPRPVY